MTEQETRILELEVRLRILEQYLTLSTDTPPLGPQVIRQYKDAVAEALKTAGITPRR